MKKLFSVSGCLVLFILTAFVAYFTYPISWKIALVGVSAGLVIILGVHHGFYVLVKPLIMQRSRTFTAPSWCDAVFLSLFFMSGLLFYVAFYKLNVQAASPQAILAIRYISALLVSSVILSRFHWRLLISDLYPAWRRHQIDYYQEEESNLESFEAEEAA